MGCFLSKLNNNFGGFIRQPNKAYAFISYDETRPTDEQILIELVDYSTLNLEDFTNNTPEWVRFYKHIELSTSYISEEKAKKIFGHDFKHANKDNFVFLVEIKYRHIKYTRYQEYTNSNILTSMNQHTTPINDRTCIVEHLYSAGPYPLDYIDLADIHLIEAQFIDHIPESQRKYLKLLATLDVESTDNELQKYQIPQKSKDAVYTFTVHNVGQALATSLSEYEMNPFFYFDYGIGYGKNRLTIPMHVSLPIANEGTTILLSHIHEDHWCGFRINPEALKCRWIIPQQPTMALKKMLSSVYLQGGTITLYHPNGLDIIRVKQTNHCMLTGNSKSFVSPLRMPSNLHETGNALYIKAIHAGKPYLIVVSGDQDYDYQAPFYLSKVNLLIACHHGGKYSWSNHTAIPTPNPDENIIVYSYGQDNSYGHPSKTANYVAAGWKTTHNTPSDLNFTIDLNFQNNPRLATICQLVSYNTITIDV